MPTKRENSDLKRAEKQDEKGLALIMGNLVAEGGGRVSEIPIPRGGSRRKLKRGKKKIKETYTRNLLFGP